MVVEEQLLQPTPWVLQSLTYFLLSIAAVLLIYHYWFQSLRYTKLGNKIPGLPGLPIVGSALTFIDKSPKETMDFLLEFASKTDKKVMRMWLGPGLGVALADPRDVELILGSHVHLEKSTEYDLFQPWLGDGLLISKGEKWRSHRRMIAPTFHQSILKTFMPTFNQNARDVVDKLRKMCVGKVCDVHDYMSTATVDILLETVMGVKKSGEAESSFKYAKAVMDMCNILHLRHYKIWMRPNFLFRFSKWFNEQKALLKIIHSLTDKVIKTKKSNYIERLDKGETSLYKDAVKATDEDSTQNISTTSNSLFTYSLKDDLDESDDSTGEKKRLAFLDFMVEASHAEGNKLSDEEIREEVNTIMFEGHDTTAAATSFFLCMLGVHQDIQEKVYQEISDVFQNSDRQVTFNDTLEMKYLERVLLETLRMYPPVPVISRVIREEVPLASSADYILPKGTVVGIVTFLIHRDADFWPNPLKFDPDRFLPENCQGRPFYSFIPFSAGPRSCVGRKYAMLKMKILLATIVKNFKIKSVVPAEDFQLQADIILKRTDGFRIVLEERVQ